MATEAVIQLSVSSLPPHRSVPHNRPLHGENELPQMRAKNWKAGYTSMWLKRWSDMWLKIYTLSGCTGLAYPRRRVRSPVVAASLAICCRHLHGAIRGAEGVLPYVGWGVTASKLDLPSLTPMSEAGSWVWSPAIGVTRWATLLALLQEVDNCPHILWK